MKIAVLITGQFRDYKVNSLNHINHLIEPNNADVFIYACTKNTIHTIGPNITQEYNETTVIDKNDLENEIISIYGDFIKDIKVMDNENFQGSFGTIAYFKNRMQNQMDNIRKGFLLAKKYEIENDIKYGVFLRLRPDNSMLPNLFTVSSVEFNRNVLYSAMFPSGHKDAWFFSFAGSEIFDIYCGFKYLEGIDESRTDKNFDCPEIAMLKFMKSKNIPVQFVKNICRPFYGFDKIQRITDFPFRNKNEKLIDGNGNLVDQIL